MSSKINLLVDLVLLLGSIPIAAALGGSASAFGQVQLPLAMAFVAIWIVTASALRHYDPWNERSWLDDVAMIGVQVIALATVLVLLRLLIGSQTAVPRPSALIVVLAPTLVGFRLAVARPLAAGDEPVDEVLIVGTGALARVTAEDLKRQRPRRQVVGFLSLPGEPAADLDGRVLGSSDAIAQVLETVPVSEVYIAAHSTRHGKAMQAAITVCETLGISFALPAHPFALDRARPADLRSIGDGYLHYVNVSAKPHQMAMKRLMDICLSGIALWLLLPLFAAVAFLIKVTSRGPIFFRQVRVGLHGRTFNMLKFRSMVVNAEELKRTLEAQNEMSGPVFKMKNDPRVTRIGRFIRKYSIDELPQLINVLRGDMTIVGPRPPVPNEVGKYLPWQRRRLSVRPGLTCIWQVSGRNQISFEEWMYLDMRYIDHWTLLEDLRLIFRTVPVVITGRGAS